MLAGGFFFISLLASIVNAVPQKRSITPLSPSEISSFKPFTYFASAAYCNPKQTINWSCDGICKANSDFMPVASGGDGNAVQFWYVGFSPSQKTVVVAHQGTQPSQIDSDLTDLDVPKKTLDASLFPGVSSSIEVHSGFADEQAKTARKVLSAVQKVMNDHKVSNVTVVGHSLGAALALLDAVYLRIHIFGVSVRIIGYGMPRVGNQAFADYIDASDIDVTHINNKKDPVPTVPGRFLGFHHPSGEVHIKEDNQWVSCSGQDNPSTQCIVGAVPNVLEGRVKDHSGPYDGVTMGVGC